MKYIAILLLLLFAGCKSAKELFDKAVDKDEKTVAAEALKKWPCVNGEIKPGDSTEYTKWRQDLLDSLSSLPIDTTPRIRWRTNISDSANFVACFDENVRLANNIEVLKGKLNDAKKKLANPPVIHDTLPVKDMKEVYLAQLERDEWKDSSDYWQGRFNVMKVERDDWRAAAKHRSWENWIWRIIAAVFITLFVYRKIRGK